MLLIFGLFAGPAGYSQGNLVIVGGGLENDNSEVFKKYIMLAGGDNAVVSVIPAASGVAAQTFAYFSQGLRRFGVKPENIRLIPVAMVDDDSTTDVNEAEWKANAWDSQLAAKVRESSAVWFSGGDQERITKLLFDEKGNPSPVMEAVWDLYRRGGVVGGTSAGAAIMSNPMIGSGTSLEALQFGASVSLSDQEGDTTRGVRITKGIGFFPEGMVDQHFHARARIGRLVMATQLSKQRFGFGIDENTALIYYGKEKRMEVAGEAGVTILDTEKAAFRKVGTATAVSNVTVHYLENGDQFHFDSQKIIPSKDKNEIGGMEKRTRTGMVAGGVFSNTGTGFFNLLTRYLFGEDDLKGVENHHLTSKESAIRFELRLQPDSRLFYSETEDEREHFTATGLLMDIEPVSLKFAPLKTSVKPKQ